MELHEKICEILSETGNAKPKKMFGTYNITLDGAYLGIVSGKKWYLKRTPNLIGLLANKGIELQCGVKGGSYVITDFSDPELIREMSSAVKDYIKAQPKKRQR